MACIFDLSGWQVTLGLVTTTIALMNLIVSTRNYWLGRRASRVSEERRAVLLALIHESISASSREIGSVAERAKALAAQIRLNLMGMALNEFLKTGLPLLAMPGAENFLELQKELRQVARGEDFRLLQFFEAIRTYQEVLVRLEAAAREQRHSEFAVLAEALLSAAMAISSHPCREPHLRARMKISVRPRVLSHARRRGSRRQRARDVALDRALFYAHSA